jgi:AcrR family transcriptional regulator
MAVDARVYGLVSSARSPETTPDTPLQSGRRATQLKRLFNGMISAANRGGFAQASVSAVIEEARVSRPTFYEYFDDREACFVETVKHVDAELLAEVADALETAAPGNALDAVVRTLVDFATSRPAEARFLMKESLAGGPRALDVRDQGIAEIARRVERTLKQAPAGTHSPDVPAVAVIGAVYRLLAARLRRGEHAIGELGQELTEWLSRYRTEVTERQWHVLKSLPVPERSPYLMPPPMRSPAPLPPGRQRLPKEQVAENHRERIMFATARAVQESGYNAVTVAIISELAGLDSRAFYRLFSDKADAFTAIHELGFQYLVSATAGAFFAVDRWPDRVWEGFRAATQSIDDTPTFAHVGFVEAYAVGPVAIQRAEDSRIAFTVFLGEGFRCQDAAEPGPSRVASEAIITTIFEIIYLEARASRKPKTASLLGHLVHVALVPFIGVEGANDFLHSKSRRRPTTSRKSDGGRSRRSASSKARRPRGPGR